MGCGASHKNRGAALDPAAAAAADCPGSASTIAGVCSANSPQALRSLEEGALQPSQESVSAPVQEQLRESRVQNSDLDVKLAAQEKRLEEQGRELQEARVDSEASIEELRAELLSRREAYSSEFESEREAMVARYHMELDQEVEEREREFVMRQSRADTLAEERRRQAADEQEAAEEHRLEQLRFLQRAEAEAASHMEETQEAEREITGLRERNEQLRREHSTAAQALLDAQESLRAQQIECQASTDEFSAREEQYAESRSEAALSEEHLADSERQLQSQMQELRAELRSRTEQLHARDEALRERDAELIELNSQLSDLQGLFDDVNQQLQTECARMAQLQNTVARCANQSKELESLQTMLEESHDMLAQVRDALESERAERVRTSRLLEHEQQRTQLLLEVLKHFKEKLQGLTPQVLLSKLGANDSKEFLSGFDAPKTVCDISQAEVHGHAPVIQSSPDFAKLNGISFASPGRADYASSTGAPDTSSHQEWATSTTLGSNAMSSPLEAWRVSPAQVQQHSATIHGHAAMNSAAHAAARAPSGIQQALPQPAQQKPRPALRGLSGAEAQQAVFLQEASSSAQQYFDAGPDAANPERLAPHRYAPYASPPFALGGMPGGAWGQQAASLHGGM